MVLSKEELEQLGVDDLKKIEWEQERQRCRTDLLYLLKTYLYPDYSYDWFNPLHKEIIEELAKLDTAPVHSPAGAVKKFLGPKVSPAKEAGFMLPRGHLKTTVATIGWPIQQVLRDQNVTISIHNAVYSTAAEFLKEIQGHLLNEQLVELFPEILYPDLKYYASAGLSWRENCINVKRTKTIRGNTIEAIGIDSSMAGKHFDKMVFDDIQNEVNSETPQAIQKLIQKYRNCFSVLKPGGTRIVIGTKWKKDDIYEWLLGHGYNFLIKSATVDPAGDPCSVLEPDARPLFAEMFTIEELRKLRKEQGAYFYSCQYENNPLPDEEITFKDEWLKSFKDDEDHPLPEFTNVYILCDPALSRTRRSDETVFSIVAQSKDQKVPLYVLNSKGIGFSQTRGDVQKVVDELFKYYSYFAQKYQVFVGIESVAFSQILQQWVEKEQRERKILFKVIELKTGNRQKETRIQRLQPLFENGGILLHPTNCDTLRTQLLSWPSSSHDDHPDALAYILDVLQLPSDGKVISLMGDKKKDHTYDDFEEVMSRLESGDDSTDWRSL